MDVSARGRRSQQTGDEAELLVRTALTRGNIACAGMHPDRGEDLLVEIDTYASVVGRRRRVRQGYVQVKGTRARARSSGGATNLKLTVEVAHLLRWSALPSQVLVVGVDLADAAPRFFASTLDDIVSDVAPAGLDAFETSDQKTVSITLPPADDLAGFVETELEAFYERHGLHLSGVSRSVIARNHYEIISSRAPFSPPTALVRQRQLRVLWKSPFRPGQLWAVLNHLSDQLQEAEGGGPVPLMATFHVYRSLRDSDANNAVAHVSWLEDEHRNTEAVRQKVGWARAGHWLRFNVIGKLVLDALPEPYGRQQDDESYNAAAGRIWAGLDAAYASVRDSLTDDARVPEAALERLESVMRDLLDAELEKLGQPSTQYTVLDRMLVRYGAVMRDVSDRLRTEDRVPERRRRSGLHGALEMAEGFHKAYLPLIQLLRDR